MYQWRDNRCICRIWDVLVDAVFGSTNISPEDPSRNEDSTCEEAAPQNEEKADDNSVSIVDGTEAEKEK